MIDDVSVSLALFDARLYACVHVHYSYQCAFKVLKDATHHCVCYISSWQACMLLHPRFATF